MTQTARKGYINTGIKLVHSIAEQRGELPVRSALELEVKGNPFANVDEVVIDDDGTLRRVQ